MYFGTRVSNAWIRNRVIGKDVKSMDEIVNLDQLRWLRHLSHMPNHYLPRRVMFPGAGIGWKKTIGGKPKHGISP